MPTLYDAKPRFQALLRPAVRALAARGATANGVTLAALGLSVAYGGAVAATGSTALLLGLPAVLGARMALNAADGLLAREHGQASPLGAKLNELGDVLSDAALYLPLALVLSPAWPVVLAVLLGIVAEFAGVAAAVHDGRRRSDGPLGKADRAALFGSASAFHALFGLSPGAVLALFVLAAGASAVTVLNRSLGSLRHA